MFLKHLRASIIVLLSMTVLTGILYPLAVTGIAQIVFPQRANGSLIVQNGKKLGSELIGQPFSEPKYFWGRLSATASVPYNGAASGGSNYGPLNSAFLDGVKKRIQDLKNADPQNIQPIPVDLVTASGSGLDPHISVAAAAYQISRVARVRGLNVSDVQLIVDHNTDGKLLGFLGESRVNVLKLNLNLDQAQYSHKGIPQ
jgi:potassium-transporting ATPase KdpC subunit